MKIFNNGKRVFKIELKFEIKKSAYLKYASNPRLNNTPKESKYFFLEGDSHAIMYLPIKKLITIEKRSKNI